MKTGDIIFGLPVEIVEIPDMPTCATCRVIDDSDTEFHGWLADRIESQLAEMLTEKLAPHDAEFDRRIFEGHPNPTGAYEDEE